MLSLKGTCPHCGSNKGFRVFGISPYFFRDPGGTRSETDAIGYSIAGVCAKCGKPVTFSCESLPAQYRATSQALYSGNDGSICEEYIKEIFPKPEAASLSRSIPEGIGKSFAYVQKMLRDPECPVEMLSRSCGDVLASVLAALGAEPGLNPREGVEDLFRKGLITASLNDWANILEEEATEAAELASFTKMLLHYAFEMPRLIDAHRTKAPVARRILVAPEQMREIINEDNPLEEKALTA